MQSKPIKLDIKNMDKEEFDIYIAIQREITSDERYFKEGLTSGSDVGVRLILDRTREAIAKHREEKRRKESGDNNG